MKPRPNRHRKTGPAPRDLDVLRAVVSMGSIAAAAAALYISPETANWHLDELRELTGLHTLAQLAAWAVLCGHIAAKDLPKTPQIGG